MEAGGRRLGLGLDRELTRTSWIPERVVLKKVTEPYLTFERAAGAWPVGTIEVAGELKALGVAPESSTRVAIDALKAAGVGRRRAVVVAAQKYRRGLGNQPRNHFRGYRREPLWEPPRGIPSP